MRYFFVIGLFIVVGACQSKPNENKVDDSTPQSDVKTAKNSVNIIGLYKGILPCADCNGIETTIRINKDETYNKTAKYIGKSDVIIEDELGDYTWKEDGNTLTLEGTDSEPVDYWVTEGKLTLVSEENGTPKTKYELIKQK